MTGRLVIGHHESWLKTMRRKLPPVLTDAMKIAPGKARDALIAAVGASSCITHYEVARKVPFPYIVMLIT